LFLLKGTLAETAAHFGNGCTE